MHVINKHDLKNRIKELELMQSQQVADIKASSVHIVHSLSASNMLKNALKDVVQSPGLRSNTVNTAIGIGAGFLAKKIYIGGSENIFRKITGSAIQFLITNFVRKKIPEMQENNRPHHPEE